MHFVVLVIKPHKNIMVGLLDCAWTLYYILVILESENILKCKCFCCKSPYFARFNDLKLTMDLHKND